MLTPLFSSQLQYILYYYWNCYKSVIKGDVILFKTNVQINNLQRKLVFLFINTIL